MLFFCCTRRCVCKNGAFIKTCCNYRILMWCRCWLWIYYNSPPLDVSLAGIIIFFTFIINNHPIAIILSIKLFNLFTRFPYMYIHRLIMFLGELSLRKCFIWKFFKFQCEFTCSTCACGIINWSFFFILNVKLKKEISDNF